ncbi:sulfate permease, partial [Ceraceosorus guamensis]
KNVIGYDDTPANKHGVPFVSSSSWLSDIFSSPGRKATEYLDSLFPFTKWILSYNSQWMIGDLIAGITVGLVVVPQSMSYAQVALLPPEYGLYSSFVGVVIYVLFATSKDVTIGPVAVMSLQTANVIRHVMEKTNAYEGRPQVIASALAFICGVVTLGIGLLRLGWIVEFIPQPAVAGFMTGSAFTIAAGQVPKLMGLSAVKTSGSATYEVIIDTLKALPNTTIDAAFGLTALFFLYFVRWVCTAIPRRYPKLARTCFFISVFRNAFVIIILTAASRIWLGPTVARNPKAKLPISILKKVPRGFQHIGQPELSTQIFSDMASEIPVSTIVLLLEHIAISKSFGRLNNYKINPNQELVAIGVTNMVGPTFGAYAATGSFSRSAIKSKSGVRTPLAGWVTAIIVLIAIYALTGTFFWIPNAALAAVIIHAVTDLIAPLSVAYKFWLVSPFELFIFLGAVILSIFVNLEAGVYFSVGASLVLLLVRIARPRGKWLGRVRVHNEDRTRPSSHPAHRDIFLPLEHKDGLRDPSVFVERPPPGVLIWKFEEAFTYPNASHLADVLIEEAKVQTRPAASSLYKSRGDRPWNDPGPVNPYFSRAGRAFLCGSAARKADAKYKEAVEAEARLAHDTRPLLRAFIFDFSSVPHVDTTSIQMLVDVRQSVERYSGHPVEFHFAGILSPWIRRGLLAGGFGTGLAARHITEVAPIIRPGESLSHKDQQARQEEEAERRGRAIDDALNGVGDDALRRRAELEDGITPAPVRRDSSVDSLDGKDSSGLSDNSSYDDRNASSVSVPILWNQSLTPFFHLEVGSALEAVT